MQSSESTAPCKPPASFFAIFCIFLRLGLTSFGGPVAHLGYFRDEFVVRRRWLSEAAYGDLVALCQFIPGPASSQVGFSLGVLRGDGLMGGVAAWLGFTMPSAIMLFAFASGASAFTGRLADGLLHGLKLVTVAVVAQAVWGMARHLTPDRQRAAIALVAGIIVVAFGGASGQIAAIAFGVLAGMWLCRGPHTFIQGHLTFPVTRRAGIAACVLFALLLFGIPMLVTLTGSTQLALFASFYRSGALVFGGGHVVLPLLQAEMVTPGWVTNESFLAGYGLAQAVPGPLFAFAAFLGADASLAVDPASGAAIALVAVFVPGLLLAYGMLPFWDTLRTRPAAQCAMRGANAAVVGILAAALYDPVWTSGVHDARDAVVALSAFLLLTVWKAAPWTVVALMVAAGVVLEHLF
jgi:chromate transporter